MVSLDDLKLTKDYAMISQTNYQEKLSKTNKTIYAYTDDELHEQKKKLGKCEIQRYKGLGEMNASQLWETTMDPKTRTIIRVGIDDAIMAEKRVKVLMGDDANVRKNWINKNVSFTMEDSFVVEMAKR